MIGHAQIRVFPCVFIHTLHLLYLLLQLEVLKLQLLTGILNSSMRSASYQRRLILLPQLLRPLRDGPIHQFVGMLPSRDLFLLLEDIRVDLDLLMLIAHIKLLTGDPRHSFLAIHLLDALQPPLVVLEVVLDAIQLHNPHFNYFI